METVITRNFRELDRAEIEIVASATTSDAGRVNLNELGQARAELVRRDRKYAEQQEQSRREFEREMEQMRNEREKLRQEFDASLALEARETARQVAKLQSEAAQRAAELQAAATQEAAERQARIGKLATWAAIASAVAAIAAVFLTIWQAIK